MPDLLKLTPKGLYCPVADVYLDPWKPVSKAIISHAHADHAKAGSSHYLCHPLTKPILEHRINAKSIETKKYGERFSINGVKFSFHPAGHIIGSCQIRVEYKGEVWVFSGDYNPKPNIANTPFESVKCNTFITESTFGLPVYKWQENDEISLEINKWWRKNKQEGVTSIICGYTLGKAQRILQSLDTSIGNIFTHTAVENINNIFKAQGIEFKWAKHLHQEVLKQDLKGSIIICPPSSIGSTWLNKYSPYKIAMCSGWMLLRGAKRRLNVDKGFVLSDHADWQGLNDAVSSSEATKVLVTHGYTDVFSQWLNEKGIESYPLKTEFEGEVEKE